MIFNWFKPQEPSSNSEDIRRRSLRNEARFKAVREQMEREGKHMLSPGFKWTPTEEWLAQKGI